MKEKIYTIPVTEAFTQDCECPLCLLENRLENEYAGYYLGPALMEPDCRIDTNRKGFCRRHFEMLYNRQENRLGLGLVTDTHMRELIGKVREAGKSIIKANNSSSLSAAGTSSDSSTSSASVAASPPGYSLKSKFFKKRNSPPDNAAELLRLLEGIEKSCAICDRLEHTMGRYLDVVMHLWAKEESFRRQFEEKKGFCLIHLKHLAVAAEKYLPARERGNFLGILIKQQIKNMERLERELDWFTKKFDYRNSDAPWGNSKDALPRSIRKLKGYCDLK